MTGAATAASNFIQINFATKQRIFPVNTLNDTEDRAHADVQTPRGGKNQKKKKLLELKTGKSMTAMNETRTLSQQSDGKIISAHSISSREECLHDYIQ